MMRSLYSAVSGLQVHQLLMDVLSNNIANVNTPGFKKATVTFQDMLSQTLQGAQGAAGGIGVGGINAQQIGLGVQIGSINTTLTQGAAATTGKSTDLMIQGEGYFILTDGSQKFYTRAGAFTLDDSGNLVNAANGMKVCDSTTTATVLDPIPGSSISIASNGTITTTISGKPTEFDQKIGLATFHNAEGLKKVGENMYIETTATGTVAISAPEDINTNAGALTAGSLEMSNVDLAQEFVNMIVAERGFQANSKSIQTSDTMLDQLIQIKR